MSQGEAEYFWKVYDRQIRRSRKRRQCCACEETISIGHRYVHIYAVGEEGVETYDRCLRCDAIFQAVSAKADRSEAIADRLDCGHTWEERFENPPPPEIARLAFILPEEAQLELAVIK